MPTCVKVNVEIVHRHNNEFCTEYVFCVFITTGIMCETFRLYLTIFRYWKCISAAVMHISSFLIYVIIKLWLMRTD